MYARKLPSGRWQVEVWVNGRRRNVSRRTKSEAMTAAAELMLEMGGSPRAAVTVGELLASWLASSDHLSITYRADAVRVIDRLPDSFTARRAHRLDTPTVEGLYRQLSREGWSPHRIGRVHAVLSSAYTLACRWGWASANPFTTARRPTPRPTAVHPPDEAEVGALLAAADDRFVLYLTMSATVGARRGEVVGLQWPDLILEPEADNAVVVRRALSYAPRVGVQITEGKTGKKGHRVVAIDGELAALLRAHRRRQVELALAAGLPSPVWLFSHDAGCTPWRPDFASREFRRLRARARVRPSVRLHDLRHFVATQLLARGVPIKTVAERLGHRQLSTTGDRYGHFVPAADRAASEVMAGVLRSATAHPKG